MMREEFRYTIKHNLLQFFVDFHLSILMMSIGLLWSLRIARLFVDHLARDRDDIILNQLLSYIFDI